MNYELRVKKSQKGQTLITLLAFVTMAIIITSGAVIVTIINSQSTSKYATGEIALSFAEAGADNAIQRLLRDPNYSGETLNLSSGSVIISVSGAATQTIISQGNSGDFKRKIQVIGNFSNNIFNIISWREID